MRKTAPALILTTLVAFASTSALALGDRAKDKKPVDTAAVPSQPTSPSASTPQVDPRCDHTKYTSKDAMPKDCFNKESKASPANQSGSSSSASGGAASGAAGSGAAGSASGSSSSSGDSK
jgi:hypothetical protein